MSRGGLKRGRDNIYDAVKAQYCEPTDEDRLTLKTPQTACAHCNVGQTRNTSEMHWHLCVCSAFGLKDPDLQGMLRTCVPESLLRSQKKKKMYETWHGGMLPLEPEAEKSKPQDNSIPKKKKTSTNMRTSTDEPTGVTLNKLIARWVYMYQIPTEAVEAPEFRDIIRLLNPEIHKLPDKESLSRNLIDVVYQQTCAQVAENLTKAESLQIQLPLDFSYHNGGNSSSSSFGDGTSQSYLRVYDGRGTFFYQLPLDARHNAYPPVQSNAIRTVEAARSILEMPNNSIVSLLLQNSDSYSEAAVTRAREILHACEVIHPHKVFISNQPFSPTACAEVMLSSVPAFNQAVTHAQCLVQYFHHASTPAMILRNIVNRITNGVASRLVTEFKLPGTIKIFCFVFLALVLFIDTPYLCCVVLVAENNTVQSVCEMLVMVSNAQQAGVFNRLLSDVAYNSYFHNLTDASATQEASVVQSILVSEAAMTGIEQAAFTLQLLLAATARSARPLSATYSDAMSLRDALIGAVNKTNSLSHPWKGMVIQVIATEWDKSHHMIMALACKMDPRRKFVDLPGAMEADAQRVRDKLIAHLEPSVRKAVLDSWVLMMKREDAFGSAFALENAHSQTPKDWWIAHTAAHKELRELVAFPALSALGVPLTGNNASSKYDPSAMGMASEADLENLVRTVGLNESLLDSNDLVCKLSYIRHNAWCLHHARVRAQDLHMKHQSRLLLPDDLAVYDYSAQLMHSASAAILSSPHASHSSHSSHASHGLHSGASHPAVYSHMDNYDFSHLADVNSNVSHAPPLGQYITLHPSGSPSHQLAQHHQQMNPRGDNY